MKVAIAFLLHQHMWKPSPFGYRVPISFDKSGMRQFVYARHLVRSSDIPRLYFHARNKANPLFGRECIGFAEAKIKD